MESAANGVKTSDIFLCDALKVHKVIKKCWVWLMITCIHRGFSLVGIFHGTFRKCKFSTTSFSVIICWPEFSKCMGWGLIDGVLVCVWVGVSVKLYLMFYPYLCCVPLSKKSSHFLPFWNIWQIIFQTYYSPWVLGASWTTWLGLSSVHPCKECSGLGLQ